MYISVPSDLTPAQKRTLFYCKRRLITRKKLEAYLCMVCVCASAVECERVIPPVDSFAIGLALQNLRCQVLGRAAESSGALVSAFQSLFF